MDKKIIIGNMKTKMNYNDVVKYIKEIEGTITHESVIFCPTSIYIPYFLNAKLKVGVQDVFYENSGSYTGELLPSQVKSMNIKYTIIGHSERRTFCKENNTIINKKIKKALEAKLGVVLCIGETIEQKTEMQTEMVLKREIFTALKDVHFLNNIVIAYEPIWAIGTGKIPRNKEIEKITKLIKDYVKEIKNYDNIKVLYGGSVNSKNIEELNKIKNVDGYLIGGASNSPSEFKEIIEKTLGE